MPQQHSRRRFLELASGAAVTAPLVWSQAHADLPRTAVIQADDLQLQFDPLLRSRLRIRHGNTFLPWSGFGETEVLELADGRRLGVFQFQSQRREPLAGPHGAGVATTLTGISAEGIEKTLRLTQYQRYPGVLLYTVSYRNGTPARLLLRGWTNAAHDLPRPAGEAAPFWSYNGGTYENRRNWLLPVEAGFAQDNYLGMSASDYGGGMPLIDIWHRRGGIAIGHVSELPRLVSLPVREKQGGAQVALQYRSPAALEPGQSLQTLETFVAAHPGDYFAALDSYRRLMGERGLKRPAALAAAYEPIWCAWGYERQCTSELIENTLPKVRDLGLSWAVIDDGWQATIGDWRPNKEKYPAGEADLRQLVTHIRDAGLKPRLWYTPLAAAPGSDLLHDHTDMLLLNADGAVQDISWWNSFYLCPAYAPTREHTLALVRKFLGDWQFEGLKIDGQHLNGVPPCYNPAHNHARPEESVEALPAFYRAIHETAAALNPHAVIELCPCGTAYSFFDLPYVDQVPASDPESSWQVRLKGKTLKALMGPAAPFAGDHVELSDGGDDFASTVGIGAVVSTKFTWPLDPKPKDSFLLTPAREAQWRHWIALYNQMRLAQGNYRGELYDIAFDKPETHAVEREGRMHYAFYAPQWQGSVTLRGLAPGRYAVRDYFNDQVLAIIGSEHPVLEVSFKRFLMLEAAPLSV